MPMVWIGGLLVLLKYLEIGPFAAVSWWWILAPLILAFIFFEVIEPMFGLDKKKAHDQLEQAKQQRLRKQLERDRARR
jgi:small Trp-rich protein